MTRESACGTHDMSDAEDLPLMDLSDQFVRRVSAGEAQRLVDIGHAEPIVSGKWRDRPDVPWTGVKLIVERDYHWSVPALTAKDALKAAGAISTDADSIAKLMLWRFVGDDKAPRVMR
jgi:hypothetical protein